MVGEYPGHTVDDRFLRAIGEAGGVPLVLPRTDAANATRQTAAIDALVLAGGQDVDASLYDGARHARSTWLDAERDRWELALLQEATTRELPVLGVCRGLQLLNVAHGGTLQGHLEDDLGHDLDMDRHHVVVQPGSLIARLCGEAPLVASAHHQAVDRVGSGLRVTARAPDGTIEAVEGDDDTLAVQWHPEAQLDEPAGQPLFDWLVRRAAARRSS
jgi:putative glutamine amidotransferase